MAKKKKGATRAPPASQLAQSTTPAARPQCSHRGEEVRVGPYSIMAGGTRYLQPQDLAHADVIVPLENRIPAAVGQVVSVLACPWQDYGPPPAGFEQFLHQQVIPLLQSGKKLLVYCIGSHGRTGSFLASLIAILEPETADPIAAVRERHCHRAVETLAQARAIFALRGEALPEEYVREFAPPPAPTTGTGFKFGSPSVGLKNSNS